MDIILQFLPYTEIANLNSGKRISKLLKIVKEEKIVVLEGRLKSEEEAELIKKTMEEINDKFKGIEISTLYPDDKNKNFLEKIRTVLVNLLIGDRNGITIIGPATIVKEIKQDPDKFHLMLNR
ncbi:MAG: DUF2073 domain-containing protein [Candidatus Woesearchaeota archaeon]